MRSGMLDPASVTRWLRVPARKPGRTRHLVPSTWVSQNPFDLVAVEVSGGRPAVRTMYDDGSLAVGQVAELPAEHTEQVLVEKVELRLGARVAGVTATARHPGDLHCWVADTDGDGVDVDPLEGRISQHEWQALDTTRHEPVSASVVATPIGRPSHRHPALDRGQSEVDRRNAPRLGAGGDDPPLPRIEDAGVLLLEGRPVRMRVGPGLESLSGRCEGVVDSVRQLSNGDHGVTVRAQR